MVNFSNMWGEISGGELQYEVPDEGYSKCQVCITENYVFKRAPDKDKERLWKSKNIMEMLYNQGVSVPEVLFSSLEENLVVYERIIGDNIGYVTEPEIARETGTQLKSIHKNKNHNFGEVQCLEDNTLTADIDDIYSYIEMTVDESDTHMAEQSTHRELFLDMKECLKNVNIRQTNSCLCHIDLDMKNVICTDKSSYFIDFMESELSIPSMDVVSFYLKMRDRGKSEEFTSAFFDGYGSKISDLPQFGVITAVIRELSVMSYWEYEIEGADKFNHKKYNKMVEDFAKEHIEPY